MRGHYLTTTTILALVLALAGCRTMRPIAVSGSTATTAFAGIEIGDLVTVQMRDGTEHRFAVSGIEGEALVSDAGRRYPRSDMMKLEHESIHAGKTITLVGGIVAGYAVLQTMAAKGFFGR